MSMSEMDKARTTPHEPQTPTVPGSDLCAECGLPPWAEVHMLAKRARTENARQARRRNVLERHKDEYAAALRELGYGVYEPDIAPLVSSLISEHVGDHDLEFERETETRKRAADYEEATNQCGCMRNPLGHSRNECPA